MEKKQLLKLMNWMDGAKIKLKLLTLEFHTNQLCKIVHVKILVSLKWNQKTLQELMENKQLLMPISWMNGAIIKLKLLTREFHINLQCKIVPVLLILKLFHICKKEIHTVKKELIQLMKPTHWMGGAIIKLKLLIPEFHINQQCRIVHVKAQLLRWNRKILQALMEKKQLLMPIH